MSVNFASDNVTGVSDKVMAAIVAANSGSATPYGNDDYSARLLDLVREVFEREELAVFPVGTGGICNALALAAVTPPYGVIYCHRNAHINIDECGCPELITGGAKLFPLDGPAGKLPPEALEAAIFGTGDVHRTQPAAVSITQLTEAGTRYSLAEIEAISQVAKAKGLPLHMDGARFANALAAEGCSPAEMTWKRGVDLLSLGATKNGCLAAELIVVFRPELVGALPFLRKRAGQLYSKMRFFSAQLLAYLEGGHWLDCASHANAMAAKLAAGLEALPGTQILHPVEGNEIFVALPAGVRDRMNARGFLFAEGDWSGPVSARLVTAFNTRAEEVESFLAALAEEIQRGG